MIRKLKETDLEQVAKIWLETNIKAHDFISSQYWYEHFDNVKEMLLQAEVYIYENEKGIQGFIGLDDEYIAGIFVLKNVQSQGIGKQLLDFIKERKDKLSLSVYQKNIKALHFYQREGFKIQCENLDERTHEKEYMMIWYKN